MYEFRQAKPYCYLELINLEKSSSMNLIFSAFRTWFLQIKNPVFQTWFFKLDFSKIKYRSTQQYFWTKSANCLRYFLKKMPHHMTIVYDLEEVNPQRQWTSAKEGKKEGKKERTLENEDIKCVDALISSW